MKAPFVDTAGNKDQVELPAGIFEAKVNGPVLHQVITARLAADRSGTSSTKTRAEVRGGGAKPWRQKGTGRARHGSIREPQWMGGGIAHGPKPRDYTQRVNKKMRTLALKAALSDRASEGKVLVVDPPSLDAPQTKRAVELLEQWGAPAKTLIVFSPKEVDSQANLLKSLRNLPLVLAVAFPTAYTVLAADTVIFTKAALDSISDAKKGPSGDDSKPNLNPRNQTSAETNK